MEEGFSLTWEDATSVVQNEEVICDIENEILPGETEEFTGVCEEVIVPQDVGHVQEVQGNEIMYIINDSVAVMQQHQPQHSYQENFIDCDVSSEEVITEPWGESCPEEIIVGSEEAIGGSEEQASEDVEIPLPTDQDEYTAARPYPCDFCSRRFRKKANLMNHMVAHQTDRPHGCNLCGVRYIRKCDLMNHLKIHAYIPETDGLDEEDVPALVETDADKLRRRTKPFAKKRKKSKAKEEYDLYEGNDKGASGSRGYDYVNEDMRLLESIENSKDQYADYLEEQHQTVETRYPITDPRKPFVCQHCGVGFAREKALASHSRIHGGDSPFECQKCGEMFWDVSLMREHLRNKHGDVEDFDDDEDDDYSEEEAKYGTYYCPTCGLSFHRQDNLKRHQRVHVKEEFINEHEFGHICNVCGESFQEALDLLAHAEVHARGSEHRCMICGEVCPDEQSVAAHVQTKHGKNLPPNTCMLCGRTCKDRRTLLKHSWEHSKEKSFACSKCAKTFHNKARLKRHMLSHRSKAVTCDVCGEEFPDGRSLMNHRHSHSSVSGRQFPCRECGKTFGSRSSQQIHIRIHTGERPYGCRFCWKAFADGGTLRKHERIHTGEKPYACAVCPRAFNQRVVLREHIRSHHSGPDPKYSHSMTPYCCSVCSDMFATSQDLIVHLIHHCDMNTAMKRQPPVGPRKYKRRRKLKPHELEMISNRIEEPVEEENHTDSEEERERHRKAAAKKPKKSPPKPTLSESYTDLYNSCSTAIENINSIVNSKSSTKTKKKSKTETVVPSRPKMIHTQKTRIPVEPGEDGRVRHKTRTLVTRTQPTELKSATGERIRPRTKNVSYHVFNADKIPVATFPEDDATQAVNNLLKMEQEGQENQENGITTYMEQTDNPPEVASEQTVETDIPVPTSIIQVSTKTRRNLNSLRPGRHLIGPGSKVVRLVKGGMIITKKKKNNSTEAEPENILPDQGLPLEEPEHDPEPEHSLEPEHNPDPELEPQEVIETQIVDNSAEIKLSSVEEYNAEIIDQNIEVTNHQGDFEQQSVEIPEPSLIVKEEIVKHEVVESSSLHELAELSMQHAQNMFKCEMCSEVFSDRAQLLIHVPIHI